MGHLACVDLRTERDILDASGPVPLFQRVSFGGGEHEGSPVMPRAFPRVCGAGRTAFRVLSPKPVSAHAAHREQKRMAFRLFSPRGNLRKWEMAE
jgi:hypothetical protein